MSEQPQALKPCPFCGSRRIERSQRSLGRSPFMVECQDCQAATKWCKYQSEADELWNQRAAPSVSTAGGEHSTLKELKLSGEHASGASLQEKESTIERAQRIVENGPTLLDAKWLDPECWNGCQSLVFKNQLAVRTKTLEELLVYMIAWRADWTKCTNQQGQIEKIETALKPSALSLPKPGEERDADLGLQEVDANADHATRQNAFIILFNQLAEGIYENAKAKGWWEKERNDGEMIALMHSELSEALEAIRNGNPPDDKIPEYLGTEAELADAIIRIMDMAHARKWRVAEAMIVKMEMNKGRPYKHGRKAF